MNKKIKLVNNFNLYKDSVILGKNRYYNYKLENFDIRKHFDFKQKISTLYVLDSNKSNLTINKKKYNLRKGDIIFINGIDDVTINNKTSLLIISLKVKSKIKKKIIFKKINKVYTVKKPWGLERWINGYESLFAFKEIFINKNHRTSLQYHEKKIESNFLIEGKATLVFKKNSKINNLKVKKHDLSKKMVKSPCVINVSPPGLHRLIAESKIRLLEVSSPHLDDVIRVQDDAKRVSGKINSEHR